jgi:glycosyltransferase involved in cell wall biosynthesis
MPHVQFVLPDLGYTAAAKQVSLIASALSDPGWSSEVYPLSRSGQAGAFTELLRANGVTVLESSGRSGVRWFGLRFLIPAPGRGVIHAFGLLVLRRLRAAVLGRHRPPILLSLTGRERLSWLDRRCLRIVNRVLVAHQHAADALSRQGIPEKRISVVPPAVDGGTGFQSFQPGQVGNLSLEIPPGGPLIVTAGSMPDRHRLLHAVWAFEFIRYPHTDAHMLVVGDGPGRAPLEILADVLAPEGTRIRFVEARPDLPAVLGMADIVLLLHRWGGANVALEAMAAGRAVVAADTPDLAAVIRDRKTGRLVPPGDARAAAATVRQLLLDPAERRRLGEAARTYVREHHPVATVVQTLEAIYQDEFTSTRSGLGAE